MSRRSLAALTLLTACTSPQYEIYLQQHADDEGSASESSGNPTEAADDSKPGDDAASSSSTSATSGASDEASGAESSGTTGAPESTATSDAPDDPPVGDAEKPVIVSVELPAHVYAAGPVPLAVEAKNTAVVHVRLDGVDAGELLTVGDGLFTGELAVRGAIDNGAHAVEVIARQGNFEDTANAGYEVKTPAPGTEAWSQPGPAGSRTNRVSITPDGDLIEVGQTETGGVPRPTIRKRSGVTGAELWPEGTITLDTDEGAAVDVAVLPDGRMWVAMNVREPMLDPRPRIALLDTDGHATEVDILGTSGRVVRAIAADAEGGCFAVGAAGVLGDWDFAYWRIDAEGVQTLGDVYDYKPTPQDSPHEFRDAAFDVVLDGDVAWVVGISQGKHELNDINVYTRGVLVPMDLHTGEVTASVIVAPMDGGWRHSVFFGGALHPEGVLVTGYGCDGDCELYRVETSLYTAAGARPWHATETPLAALVYGSDVALDSQGRALVAGAVTQNGKLRGRVFGRVVGENGQPALQHEYPGLGPSEALGIARDGFDRFFPAGYITINGQMQARITLIHG